MFRDYRLDDATITKLTIEKGVVRLLVRNWRDENDVLIFGDVVGVESMSFINTDLSHGLESESDDFLDRCCTVGEEAASEYRCFLFFSAWQETPILKIVARSFAVGEFASDETDP